MTYLSEGYYSLAGKYYPAYVAGFVLKIPELEYPVFDEEFLGHEAFILKFLWIIPLIISKGHSHYKAFIERTRAYAEGHAEIVHRMAGRKATLDSDLAVELWQRRDYLKSLLKKLYSRYHEVQPYYGDTYVAGSLMARKAMTDLFGPINQRLVNCAEFLTTVNWLSDALKGDVIALRRVLKKFFIGGCKLSVTLTGEVRSRGYLQYRPLQNTSPRVCNGLYKRVLTLQEDFQSYVSQPIHIRSGDRLYTYLTGSWAAKGALGALEKIKAETLSTQVEVETVRAAFLHVMRCLANLGDNQDLYRTLRKDAESLLNEPSKALGKLQRKVEELALSAWERGLDILGNFDANKFEKLAEDELLSEAMYGDSELFAVVRLEVQDIFHLDNHLEK